MAFGVVSGVGVAEFLGFCCIWNRLFSLFLPTSYAGLHTAEALPTALGLQVVALLLLWQHSVLSFPSVSFSAVPAIC